MLLVDFLLTILPHIIFCNYNHLLNGNACTFALIILLSPIDNAALSAATQHAKTRIQRKVQNGVS